MQETEEQLSEYFELLWNSLGPWPRFDHALGLA
jgi:hypothetical protein